jgi:hypothetical protein
MAELTRTTRVEGMAAVNGHYRGDHPGMLHRHVADEPVHLNDLGSP